MARYLKYEANQISATPDKGEVAFINSDGTVDLYTGATDPSGNQVLLAKVPIMGSYTPKIGDWVGINWESGFPIVMGDVVTTLVSVNDRIDGQSVIRNENQVSSIHANIAENLLINSGFELDSGWTMPQSDAGVNVAFSKDRTQLVFGTKALTWSVANNTSSGYVYISQTVANIKEETDYCFSYFYKDNGNAGLTHEIKIEQYTDSTLVGTPFIFNPPLTSNWSRYDNTFKTSKLVNKIVIYIRDKANTTNVNFQSWYDACQLEIGNTASAYNSTTASFEVIQATGMAVQVNLIENSSFEYFDSSNNLIGWVIPSGSSGTVMQPLPSGSASSACMTVALDTTKFADLSATGTSRSLRVTSVAQSVNNFVETSKPYMVNGNDWYTVSAFVTTDSIPSANPVHIDVAEFTSGNLTTPYKITELVYTRVVGTTNNEYNGFQQIYQSFQTGLSTAYVKIRLTSPNIPAGKAVYWDCIQLQRGQIQTNYNPREIVGTQIANGVITTEHLIVNGIDAKVIKAGTIDGTKIQASAITADKLSIGRGGRNYVKNSSFENLKGTNNVYDVINWTPSVASTIARSPNTTSPYTDATTGINGEYCLRHTNTSTTTSNYVDSTEFAIKSNTTYSLSAYLKAGSYLKSGVQISVCVRKSTSAVGTVNYSYNIINPSINTSTWTLNTATFTTSTDPTYYAWIRIYNPGSTTTGQTSILYVDQLQLEEGSLVTDWTPYPDEVRAATGNVIVNDEGLMVSSGLIKVTTASGDVTIDSTGILAKNTTDGTKYAKLQSGGLTIKGGAISVDTSTAGTGARLTIDSTGLKAYNSSGTNTISIGSDGNIVMNGGTIDWNYVSKPSYLYSDIGGTKPPSNADNTTSVIGTNRLTKIDSNGIYTGTVSGNYIELLDNGTTNSGNFVAKNANGHATIAIITSSWTGTAYDGSTTGVTNKTVTADSTKLRFFGCNGYIQTDGASLEIATEGDVSDIKIHGRTLILDSSSNTGGVVFKTRSTPSANIVGQVWSDGNNLYHRSNSGIQTLGTGSVTAKFA